MERENKVMKVYNLLFERFGKRYWWPAETPFEVVVGAILTQQTAWSNVEKAIQNLKGKGLLGLENLANADENEICEFVRPAGYYRQKTKRLLGVSKYIYANYGTIEDMLEQDTESVRKELLSLNGIGPETADSILCYAGKHLKFVVDAYTYRLCNRLPLLQIGDGKEHAWDRYHKVQRYFEENMPRELEVYREYHALIVECGKRYCKTKPNCISEKGAENDKCPLAEICNYYRLNYKL
jgi:endonuclease-3 related protein